MNIEELIDRFVDHVNAREREAMDPEGEYPIVQLDHEVALQSGGIKIVKPIAPSFIDFVTAILNGSPRG